MGYIYFSSISVGDRVAGGLQPPYLGRNLLYSGNFPERTIRNLDSFMPANFFQKVSFRSTTIQML